MIRGRVSLISRNLVRGWVWDSDAPETSVDLVVAVDEQVVARIRSVPKADALGLNPRHVFQHVFRPPLSVASPHEVVVSVASLSKPLRDGAVSLPAIDAAPIRRSLGEAGAGGLSAVFITALPRSGTTLLMHELAAHPAIVVPQQAIYEHLMASYFSDLFRIGTAPAYPGQPHGLSAHFRGSHRVGPNPYYAHRYQKAFPSADAMDYFHQVIVPEHLRRTVRALLGEFHALAAVQAGKRRARYFAEKLEPAARSRASVKAVFPDAREIVLVRDPRDIFASNKLRYRDPARLSIRQLRTQTAHLLDVCRRQSAWVMVLRYEDLMRERRENLLRLFAFLSLPPLDERDDQAARALFERHGTSPSPSASIGRWREVLTPDERAEFREQLGAFMEHFGYAAT